MSPEVDEVDIPPPTGLDASDNVWKNNDGVWMTTFPPPPGFNGCESGAWDGFSYHERTCTAEEAELLDADLAGAEAEERAEITLEAEAQRDAWFEMLKPPSPSEPAAQPLPTRAPGR